MRVTKLYLEPGDVKHIIERDPNPEPAIPGGVEV